MSSFQDSQLQQTPIVKIFEGVGSIGAIFVCSTFWARDVEVIKEKGIQAVISAEKDQQVNLPRKDIPEYLYLDIEDDVDFNISRYFQKSFEFIEENRRKFNILIHCSTGLNCSIALVIAYLIKKYQYTYHEAINIIRRRFTLFNAKQFNPGFAHQLEYFAVKNGDFNLVKDNHLRKRIQRTRRTIDGLVRSYSKELTRDEKLIGIKSPQKGKPNSLKTFNSMTIKNIKSQSFLPYQSTSLLPNPQQQITQRQFSQQYMKFLPKQSAQQIQDQQHHKKIVSQIFLLTQQSKIYISKRMQSVRSDQSVMKNYDRLKQAKKNHLTFYSPLKKYQKYQMFTQGFQQGALMLDKKKASIITDVDINNKLFRKHYLSKKNYSQKAKLKQENI